MLNEWSGRRKKKKRVYEESKTGHNFVDYLGDAISIEKREMENFLVIVNRIMVNQRERKRINLQ